MAATHAPFVGGIFLTTQAASKLKELKQKEDTRQWGLRFADKRGFCGSGYEYIIDFISNPQPQDEVFYSHGIPIYVPRESLPRLRGSISNITGMPMKISG